MPLFQPFSLCKDLSGANHSIIIFLIFLCSVHATIDNVAPLVMENKDYSVNMVDALTEFILEAS